MNNKGPKTLEELIAIIDKNAADLKQNQKLDWGYLGSRGITKDYIEKKGIEILKIKRVSGAVYAKVPLDLIAEQWRPPNSPAHLKQIKEAIDEVLDANEITTTLWRDPKTSRLFVVDGGHRFEVSYSLGIPYLICSILIEKDAEWYKKYRAEESLARADIGEFRVTAQYLIKWKESYHNVFDPLDVLTCIKSKKADKFASLKKLASEVRTENQAEYACDFMQEWMDENHLSIQTATRYFKACRIISGENEHLIGRPNISLALILEADSRLRAVEHDYELTESALNFYINNYDKILGWVLETTADNSNKKNSILANVIKAVGNSLEKNIPLEFEKKKEKNDDEEKKKKVRKIEPGNSTDSITKLLTASPHDSGTVKVVAQLAKESKKRKYMLPIPEDEITIKEYNSGDVLNQGHFYALAEGNIALFSLSKLMQPVSSCLGYGLLKIGEGYVGIVTSKNASIARLTMQEWRTGNATVLNHRMTAMEQQVCSDRELIAIRNSYIPEGRVIKLIRTYQKNNQKDEISLSTKEIALYAGIDTQSASRILGFLHKEKMIEIIDPFTFHILPNFSKIPDLQFDEVTDPFGLKLSYFLDKNYLVQSGGQTHLAKYSGGKHACDTYRIPLPGKFEPWENLSLCNFCASNIPEIGEKIIPADYLIRNAAKWKIETGNDALQFFMTNAAFLSFNGNISRDTAFTIYDDSLKKVAMLQPNIFGSIKASNSSYRGHVLVQKK